LKGYLGETIVEQAQTKFKDHTPFDWAMYFVEKYGQIDGEEHKAWVLDVIAQIHKGASVIIKVAKWDNGHEEFRVSLSEPTEKYNNWVIDMMSGEGGENTYSYDTGTAP
jgi:hypothetical protein